MLQTPSFGPEDEGLVLLAEDELLEAVAEDEVHLEKEGPVDSGKNEGAKVEIPTKQEQAEGSQADQQVHSCSALECFSMAFGCFWKFESEMSSVRPKLHFKASLQAARGASAVFLLPHSPWPKPKVLASCGHAPCGCRAARC